MCVLLGRAVPELGYKQGYVMQFAVTPPCIMARERIVFLDQQYLQSEFEIFIQKYKKSEYHRNRHVHL